GFDQDLHPEDEGGGGEQKPEQARQPQRRDRERGESLDRESDQRIEIPARAPVDALGRFVVDADLAESDPARETLEEPVAFRQLLERRRSAGREQPEVAGIGGGSLAFCPTLSAATPSYHHT